MMKKAVLIVITACVTYVSFAQQAAIRDVTIESTKNLVKMKYENNSATQTLDLNCYNEDFCNYLLVMTRNGSYDVRPGKTTVSSEKKTDKNNKRPVEPKEHYTYYRGKFLNDFAADAPYALPVAPGKTTSFTTDLKQREKTMQFTVEPLDTVYACRGGVACNAKFPNVLLISHKDNTFSTYLTLAECFVIPGMKVDVGDPVGICMHDDLSISFFFLDRNRFEKGKANGYPYAHYFPYFMTDQGKMRLEEETEYQAVRNDEVMTLDMNKAEKRKYLKRK